jgi:hypothetical protein
VKPTPHRFAIPQRIGPPGQNHEDRLEGVLSLVAIAQDLTTDPEDHRAVADYQLPEGLLADLISTIEETSQHVSVAQACTRATSEQDL